MGLWRKSLAATAVCRQSRKITHHQKATSCVLVAFCFRQRRFVLGTYPQGTDSLQLNTSYPA